MKISSCPDEVAAPTVDYTNYDHAKTIADEAAHQERLKEWLLNNSWPGPRTGEILSLPMGDGHANYMFADGAKPCLIHLPYGDAWHSPDVGFLPKKEVLRRIDARKNLTAIFSGQTAKSAP